MKIELLRNGSLHSTLSTSTSIGTNGTGSFSWTPSTSLPLDTTYTIRITSNQNSSYTDTSDATFSLTPAPSITLVSPNGGESWSLGSSHTIQWNYAGSVGTAVMIELLKAGGPWSTLSASTPIGSGGTGSFSWNIDPALAVASDYQIRIISTSNTAIADISDGNFTLTPVPSYTLTVTEAGAGSGTVTGADINCGTDCSGIYPQGTQVTLTASAAAGSTFAGWGGACAGTGGCSVVMDAAKSVSATFDPLRSFDFGAPPPSATVIAGQPANYAIVLNGQAGFTGSVSLSCTAGVPPVRFFGSPTRVTRHRAVPQASRNFGDRSDFGNGDVGLRRWRSAGQSAANDWNAGRDIYHHDQRDLWVDNAYADSHIGRELVGVGLSRFVECDSISRASVQRLSAGRDSLAPDAWSTYSPNTCQPRRAA